ncbi:UDP-glucose dehydrogenase family protein [Halalkalibacter akibai]|uniref:UDP-glucose 6-dehydrogenase n=1 Tax=Halalkalibacter akibai (strain ATCC 43226 / DSM 21942 / CIP 109018 / JCM 9157 / 1139) TaxID=1236973 RepID=W4QWK8_HALA3|nr:UDP-glucose/GDP-mannose dehydrogenase family protein [Halalkalibacter akibai]GAE36505.1 UDP-glucose dehydrogenase [Halalkalibacter akibai JCM 9157]
MEVCVIGAGYVGLTTSAVLADFGHSVYCVDKDKRKIEVLLNGKVPIYEPGLDKMIERNIEKGNLVFTSNLKEAINKCSIIFIAVGTPLSEDGKANLRFYHSVIEELSPLIDSYKVIVTKSTVPIGTNERLNQTLLDKGVSPELFDVVSNPEFLREGTALYDMLHPDKIVIGVKNPKPIEKLQKLYKNLQAPYIITSLNGAEMIKYASNAFLAMKISFINELAQISDAYKVDIKDVSLGLGTDPRIGPHFLQAGLGYGGSCLPKDLAALEYQSLTKGITPVLLQSAQAINNRLIEVYIQKLKTQVANLQEAKITVWGAAFKPNTDDTRHSQAIKLMERLRQEGCDVHVFDPIVKSVEGVTVHDDMYASIDQSDALVIATEWPEFLKADWDLVKAKMNGTIVLDCRNCVQPRTLKHHGLTYIGVARP